MRTREAAEGVYGVTMGAAGPSCKVGLSRFDNRGATRFRALTIFTYFEGGNSIALTH
jgi:hypothetical protein